MLITLTLSTVLLSSPGLERCNIDSIYFLYLAAILSPESWCKVCRVRGREPFLEIPHPKQEHSSHAIATVNEYSKS